MIWLRLKILPQRNEIQASEDRGPSGRTYRAVTQGTYHIQPTRAGPPVGFVVVFVL